MDIVVFVAGETFEIIFSGMVQVKVVEETFKKIEVPLKQTILAQIF